MYNKYYNTLLWYCPELYSQDTNDNIRKHNMKRLELIVDPILGSTEASLYMMPSGRKVAVMNIKHEYIRFVSVFRYARYKGEHKSHRIYTE